MKKLILFISFIFSIGFVYCQRVTDTNKLIVRDSAIFNNEALKITAATNGQYLQRIAGRWVNGNGQYIDTIQIINDMLQISLFNDKKAMQSVGLASYMDDVGLTVWVNGEEKEVNIKQINFESDTSLNIENNGYLSYKFAVDTNFIMTIDSGLFLINSAKLDLYINDEEKEVNISNLNFKSDTTVNLENPGFNAVKITVDTMFLKTIFLDNSGVENRLALWNNASDLKDDADLSFNPSINELTVGSGTGNGSVTSGNFILSSDRRLKKSIQPIGNVGWVDDIHFKSFYMDNDLTGRVRYGVIAQEVEKVNPYLIFTGENGYKAVGYIDLLIAKVARQDQLINDLIKRIEKLENEK